jgi:hypothetical protein
MVAKTKARRKRAPNCDVAGVAAAGRAKNQR